MHSAMLLAYSAFMSIVLIGFIAISIYPMLAKKGNDKFKRSFNPRVLVILPCKGADLTLEDNIASVKKQHYKNFKLIGVIDSDSDSAAKYLRAANVEYLISKKYKGFTGSGKTKAISTALDTFKNYDICVIADSDVLFSSDWLDELVKPLQDERYGISTAYPLFKPAGGFWAWVKMIWSFVGNGLMESEFTRFGWGGSLAFRRNLLSGKNYKYFKNSISDDIPITQFAKKRNLKIYYVNKHVATVNSNDNFMKFFEWSNRQTAFSILGNKRIFWMGMTFYLFNYILLVSGIILSIYVSYAFIIFLGPFFIGMYKTYTRIGSFVPMLPIYYLTANAIYIANLLIAKRMKSIKWRGETYKLNVI